MFRKLAAAMVACAATTGIAVAQNSNSSTTVRPRTTTTQSNTNSNKADTQRSTDVQRPATTAPAARNTTTKPRVSTETPGSQGVVEAFNSLINGIRKADVKLVSNAYWNSPRLLLFNNNGTVTKGWEQMRKNRESSYRNLKDVKLEIKDLSITMVGRDGAVITCLWTQSQTYDGAPEAATGRMTLVFRRVGKEWKAIHLHTSPDRPDPSRVLPSEQTATPTPNP